jgi:hypothetical protein
MKNKIVKITMILFFVVILSGCTDGIDSGVVEKSSIQESRYSCNCSKTCSQMSSCAEAQYQLNICGCSRRDGDKDGIACDSDCQ